jgi:hypothetical protein
MILRYSIISGITDNLRPDLLGPWIVEGFHLYTGILFPADRSRTWLAAAVGSQFDENSG